MDAPASRSPSPPPDAPVASTPGPRATALQKVFEGALSASLKAHTYSNFSTCFPTPARHCPGAIEQVWGALNGRLKEECTREFEQILEDRRVVDGLNQWEKVVDEARKRRDRAVEGEIPQRPLHTLSPEELYTAHLTPYLLKETEELQTKVHKSQQENLMVIGKINEQRAEIERLLNGLENVVKDVEGSIDAMRTSQQTGFDGLRDDVWQMEQEVAATRR